MRPLLTVSFPKDAYITIEDSPNAGRFYIITEGEAQVFKSHGFVRYRKNSILGPGDSFATVACLSGHKEIETVKAKTDLTLVVVERSQFAELAQTNTKIAMKIIMQFVSNIRMLNATLSNITLLGSGKREIVSDDPAPQLYRVGEFYQSKSMFNQAYYAYLRCTQNYVDSPFSITAKEEMEKIKSHVTQEKFDYPKEEFKRVYPKNAMLFAESELGNVLFFIVKGKVKVTRIEDNREVTLSIMSTGDICGMLAMLEGLPHTTNAMTLEECETLAVGPMGFETVTKTQPQFLFKISSILAEQIWFLHKQIANRSLYDPLVRLYDMLTVMLEKGGVPAGEPYTFYFGLSELVEMTGYAPQNCDEMTKRLFSENMVRLDEEGKIHVVSSLELVRKNEANWKQPVFFPFDQEGTD
ncbi:MAG: cyclic nucleotide-binding domain-containing protein [Spirochaetaceae bacterium]|jgi:CRP-like cAMP-binding protein|nr:cyclic nucleotide-binding domain-containing protein [Spirochaetaceae bacterium]